MHRSTHRPPRAARLLACGLLLLLAALRPGPARALEGLPFCAGERLVYTLRWAALTAGESSIEVLPPTEVDGTPALHFRMRARTTEFVDFFYKVRDRVDAFTDTGLNRSLLYLKEQREGSYERDITVRFDWDRFKALYSNTVNGPKEPIGVYPGTFDPLSVFYAFRVMPLKVGATVLRPVTDGVKCVLGRATVLGRETVEVPAGTFDCYLVEPDLSHVGGVFRKSPGAALRIWVTADARRIPVRISSKVVVGSFHALLTEIQGPEDCYAQAAPAP